ncbi:MAG TPA: Crp/Fnr family transcriptional regulator [Bryobacterales bacterium]|jgi:CRP/FNR family transcriptional regulator|nr:Crp/Fnr family transcriptional regulator [Bryobacterales bacterium]
MSSTATNLTTFAVGSEDPLTLLPHTPVRAYKKNEVIYGPEDRVEALYLVVDGRVKISRLTEGGKEVILDFYHKDDFFGETGFLGSDHRGERASALDATSVMLWTIPELKRLMQRTPALGPALIRVVTQKLADANQRIESFCLDAINRRLVKALLHLAERFGQQGEAPYVHLLPITHEQLARYVGTSREIVTQYMNQFRHDGLLRYSRRGVDLDIGALKKYLGEVQA